MAKHFSIPRSGRKLILLILFVLLPALFLVGNHRVVQVLDGDTLEVLTSSGVQRVRLHGIDAPERGQPFSQKAKEFVLEHAAGRKVRIEVRDRDRFGRMVAVVVLPSGEVLNHLLVRAGLAFWYRRYDRNNTALKEAEELAKKEKRGVWSQRSMLPPWEYRRQNRPERWLP